MTWTTENLHGLKSAAPGIPPLRALETLLGVKANLLVKA